MGCVSSSLLSHEDEFAQLGSSAIGNHIVSLTSTTYGFLTLDPPQSPSTPPSRFPGSIFPTPLFEARPLWSEPEVINSWELMDGLDIESSRSSPLTPPKPCTIKVQNFGKENSNPNPSGALKPLNEEMKKLSSIKLSLGLDQFERICPPNGENRLVIYTTTLRGVRKTFEACNAVRVAIEASGVILYERDVSMDSGFKEELRDLLKGKARDELVPPRVFVKGRYIGGAEKLLKIVEDGLLGELLQGLPRKKVGAICEGCGNMKFLPCLHCNGSCKIVKEDVGRQGMAVVIRCTHCNENGLTLCPICS